MVGSTSRPDRRRAASKAPDLRATARRAPQPRTRAGRTGFRRRGSDKRMGSRMQRRHRAPGWCSRDRPSPERELTKAAPGARVRRTDGITNATTTPKRGPCSRERPSPEREPAEQVPGGEGMTTGWDHERNDDTPRADRARAIDPAQNASRPNRLRRRWAVARRTGSWTTNTGTSAGLAGDPGRRSRSPSTGLDSSTRNRRWCVEFL